MRVASGRQPSVTQGQHSFAQIPSANIARSVFNRNHGVKTTLNSGALVPVYVDEALPGDTITMKMTAFCRMATPLFPVMDNQWLDVFFFAIPNRLVWDNWQKFNGEQDDPGDSTVFAVPTMTSPGAGLGYTAEQLQDYLGVPIGVPDLVHSALFTRAYNLTWNEWFRDENLQDSLVVDKDDGPDDPADYFVVRRGKRKDYFTSALPWPQKGPAVSIPILDSAPINITGDGIPQFIPAAGSGGSADALLSQGASGTDVRFLSQATTNEDLKWDDPKLETDLSAATNATINQLREAFQIQKLYERDARGGTRYTEILRAHFGVVSPDQRLQRPEFLGGGSFQMTINAVANTSDSGTGNVGSLGAFAVAAGTGTFHKSFTEHCIILGLVATRADLNYQQGLNKMFTRSTRFDFYWPALAAIGEQTILNKEIYAQGSVDPTADEAVFGYQERYAEYRYKPSMTTGVMRSGASGTLDAWHLAQDFAVLPTLNAAFIEENPPIDRILAVPGSNEFLLDTYFQLRHARPMPTYGVPGMIDHF